MTSTAKFLLHTWPVAGAMQAVKMDGKERAKLRTPQPGFLLALHLRNQLVLDTKRTGLHFRHVLSLGEPVHLTTFQSIFITPIYWHTFTGKLLQKPNS